MKNLAMGKLNISIHVGGGQLIESHAHVNMRQTLKEAPHCVAELDGDSLRDSPLCWEDR